MPKSITEYILTAKRQRYDEPLFVKGSFLWLSDVELPFQDAAFMNNCIRLAQAYGVQQCVLAGDLFHAEAFSPFRDGTGDVDGEIAEVDEYLPGLLEPFAKYYFFVGNHDQRIAKALGGKTSDLNAIRLMIGRDTLQLYYSKVEASEYRWMKADYNWRLTHGKNVSQIPANVARRYAEKFQSNVIHAHTHHQGQMHDVSGRFWGIESGCCVDISRLEYANTTDTAGTAMVNGAVLMLDTGRQYSPLLLNKWTDWQYEAWRAGKLKMHL